MIVEFVNLIIKERYHKKNKGKIPNFLGRKIETNFIHNLIRYYKKDKFKILIFLDLKTTTNVCSTLSSTYVIVNKHYKFFFRRNVTKKIND